MSRKIIGQLRVMPIEEVEKYIGKQIEALRGANRPNALLMAMSIAEYLKDARRWHYVKTYTPTFALTASPADVQEDVDRAIKSQAKG